METFEITIDNILDCIERAGGIPPNYINHEEYDNEDELDTCKTDEFELFFFDDSKAVLCFSYASCAVSLYRNNDFEPLIDFKMDKRDAPLLMGVLAKFSLGAENLEVPFFITLLLPEPTKNR